MKIEMYIPTGKENAIPRADLARILGMTDRACRKAIEDARNRGALIVAGDGGEGYYITDDLAEIERQYRIDRARALAVLKRLKTMRRMLRDAGKKV